MNEDTLNATTLHTLRCIGRFGAPHCVERAMRLYLSVGPASARERARRLEELSSLLMVHAAAEPHIDNIYATITEFIGKLSPVEMTD